MHRIHGIPVGPCRTCRGVQPFESKTDFGLCRGTDTTSSICAAVRNGVESRNLGRTDGRLCSSISRSWHGQPDSNRHLWVWSPGHNLYTMSVFGLGGRTRTCIRRINCAMHDHCATPYHWKSGRDSNPCTRCCRPRPRLSVTGLLKFMRSPSFRVHGAVR